MFHAKDGLFFEKVGTAVRIVKRDGLQNISPITFDVTMDYEMWCSIIANMSYHGEGDRGWYRAVDFHLGTNKDLDKIHTWINSPEGQKELGEAYEETKKVVDDLVKSRFVDSETLHRPFDR